MKVEYSLTEQDYIKYNIDHMHNSETGKKALRTSRFFQPMLFLLAPFLLNGFFHMKLSYWMLSFVVIFIAWVIFYPKFLQRSITRKVEMKMRTGSGASLLGNRVLELQKNEIVEKSSSGEFRKGWDAVQKIIETDRHIYIYISASAAFIIPLSAFLDANAKDEFLSFINKRSGKTVQK